MKLAYLILAHGDPGLLVRSIEKLDGSGDIFLVHVDKKGSPDIFSKYENVFKDKKNVILVPQRVAVHWGDFSVVQAQLNVLRFLCDQGWKYDYVILWSGSHYPIKSRDVIRDYFQTRLGKIFLAHHKIPAGPPHAWSKEGGGMDRIVYPYFFWGPAWVHRLNYLVRSGLKRLKLDWLIKRRYSFDLQLYGGSTWWCLDQEAAGYILDFAAKNKKFVSFFRSVKIPSEIFLHTILMASPHRHRVVNDDLLYVQWPSQQDTSHPCTLTRKDLPALAASDKLFARKFDGKTAPGFLDEIETSGRAVKK